MCIEVSGGILHQGQRRTCVWALSLQLSVMCGSSQLAVRHLQSRIFQAGEELCWILFWQVRQTQGWRTLSSKDIINMKLNFLPPFSVTLATRPPWFVSDVTPLVTTVGVMATETVWAVERTTSSLSSGDSVYRTVLQVSTKTEGLRPVTNVTLPARPAAVKEAPHSLFWLCFMWFHIIEHELLYQSFALWDILVFFFTKT